MTTDWLIALAVEDSGAYVAVEDSGEEWNALRAMSAKRAFTFDEALDWLRDLPDAPSSLPGTPTR